MTCSPRLGGAATAARSGSSSVTRLCPLGLCLIAVMSLLPGCSSIDRARRGTDVVVGVAQQYKLETLVQADLERRRLRAARCYSPLLTPATLSAAATDERLGPAWVDGLLRDCPQFGAFLSELMMRRARAAGLASALTMSTPLPGMNVPPLPVGDEPRFLAEPADGPFSGGVDDGVAPSEPVLP